MTRHAIVLALIALTALQTRVAVADACSVRRVTFYAIEDFWGGHTADGTSVHADEWLAAANDLPLGAVVDVDGIGVYRIADRGLGGPGWIDLLVPTRAEALALGVQYRQVCRLSP